MIRSAIAVSALVALLACGDQSRGQMYFDCTMENIGTPHVMALNLSERTANIDWGFYREDPYLAGRVDFYEVSGVSDEQIKIVHATSDDYRERGISRIDGRYIESRKGLVSKSTGVCKQIDNPYSERAF